MKIHYGVYLCTRIRYPTKDKRTLLMKQFYSNALTGFAKLPNTLKRSFAYTITSVLAIMLFTQASAQVAVTGIVTDYNGYWKSGVGSVNSIKPTNSHNLLAFTYNNRMFSTGVNDNQLTAHSENFSQGDFWSLPIENITTATTTNTKIGVGEMYDGLHNGAGTVPVNDPKQYLTDGIKGLDLGTGVANLPAGNLTFFVNNIRPENIGDGFPDVVVTQIADPSAISDRYAFLDANGNIVGNYRDIVFSTIAPVGNWTADFWEASRNPMALAGGFTNTDRALRLWAADLSEFGITPANAGQVRKFKIILSGDSDVAFVAYNKKTIAITTVLPLSLNDFTAKLNNGNTILNWSTATEDNTNYFAVEKSTDNSTFTAIDSVKAAGNSTTLKAYKSTDTHVATGKNYYRLRMTDLDGVTTYSKTILVVTAAKSTLAVQVYPNPATTSIRVDLPSTDGDRLSIYNIGGSLVSQISLNKSTIQATVNVSQYVKGTYYLVWQCATERISQPFIVK